MNTTRRMKSALAALALIGTIGLAGCGGDSTAGTTDTTAAAESKMPGEITFDGMWARTSPAGASMGAAYLTITSPVDDALTGVSVDASVAKMAQIHETVMSTGSSMSSDSTAMSSGATMAPSMTMQEVDKIDLPAGTKVDLKPGGYHIMLMGLAKPLETGSKISLTLTFRDAGEKTVEFPVMEDAPAGS